MVDLGIEITGMFTTEELIRMFGLEEGGRVQQAIDKAVIDYSLPYWAWDTGECANSAYDATTIGSGEVVWEAPYILPIYYGMTSKGTPINYNTSHNPMAGAYPVERMWADRKEDIAEEARRVAFGQ